MNFVSFRANFEWIFSAQNERHENMRLIFKVSLKMAYFWGIYFYSSSARLYALQSVYHLKQYTPDFPPVLSVSFH